MTQTAGAAMFALQQANRQPQELMRLLAQVPVPESPSVSLESTRQAIRPDGTGRLIDTVV